MNVLVVKNLDLVYFELLDSVGVVVKDITFGLVDLFDFYNILSVRDHLVINVIERESKIFVVLERYVN